MRLTNAEGVVMLYLDLKISPREMAQWTAPEIRGFFDGIARAVEAVDTARTRIAGEGLAPSTSRL